MIYLLYLTLAGLLLMAVSLVLLFYYRNQQAISGWSVVGINVLVIIFSVGIYRSGNSLADIKQWYAYGKRQYQFLTEYEKLGGINGMIKRIQRRLDDGPDDFQGWVMLGKLYLAKLEYREAADAFSHALQLQPDDREVQGYLALAKRS